MEPAEGPPGLYHPCRHSDRPLWPPNGRVLRAHPCVPSWRALSHMPRSSMTCGSALVKKPERDKMPRGRGYVLPNIASWAEKVAKKCQTEETNLSVEIQK